MFGKPADPPIVRLEVDGKNSIRIRATMRDYELLHTWAIHYAASGDASTVGFFVDNVVHFHIIRQDTGRVQ